MKHAHDDDGRKSGDNEPARRAYVTPELVEYGTLAKLTQAGGGTIADLAGMMQMNP